MIENKNGSDLPDLTNLGQLLHGVTLQRERVPVPEWGCNVWVYELTGEELDLYRSYIWTEKGGKIRMTVSRLRAQTARLLAVAIRREDGSRIFDDATGPDRLMQMGSSGLEKLAKVARRLSGVSDDDAESSAEGNSEAGPTGSGSGTSPSPSVEPVESSSAV